MSIIFCKLNKKCSIWCGLKIFVTQANSEIKRSEKDVFGCCMATRILK